MITFNFYINCFKNHAKITFNELAAQIIMKSN